MHNVYQFLDRVVGQRKSKLSGFNLGEIEDIVMSPSKCLPFRWMRSTADRIFSGGLPYMPSSMSSEKPSTAFSGVRNS